MKLHELKLQYGFAISKMQGFKTFEIRKNDRNFEVGDLVHYTVVGCEDLETDFCEEVKSSFKYAIYKIVYITNYNQYPDYIVFSETLLYC